jgi:hypothetical protein
MCLKKKLLNILFVHGPYNCTIDLEEDAKPPFGLNYNLSQDEFKALSKYLDEKSEKRFIQHSKSPIGVP